MSYTEMPEVVGVTLNDIEDVIAKTVCKVAFIDILRSRDDKIVGTAAAQIVSPKGGINHMHGVDHAADGRFAVARYIHDAGNVHAAADQETTTGKWVRKLSEKGLQC